MLVPRTLKPVSPISTANQSARALPDAGVSPTPMSLPEEGLPFIQHRAATGVVAVVLAGVAFVAYPFSAKAFIAAALAAVLVVLAVTDLERRIIPNRVVMPAIAAVLLARIGFYPGHSLEWIFASVGIAIFLMLPNLVNPAAIGMGDVKLGALLGAGLGWNAINALALGFLLLTPLAIATLVTGGTGARTRTLPLGPFVAVGGIIVLIVPQLLGLATA